MITIHHVTRENASRAYDLLSYPSNPEIEAWLAIITDETANKDDRQIARNMYRPAKNKLLAENAAKLFGEGAYQKMVEIDTDDLDEAYRITQNGVVTESWTLEPPEGTRPLVAPINHNGKTYGHRSTSVGDILDLNGKRFVVADFGFIEIEG